MELELQYASMNEVPAGFESLYTEQDGKAVLTGVKGLSGIQGSVQRLTTALNKERADHKETKAKAKAIDELGMSVEDAITAIAERDELKIRVESGEGGKVDDAKIAELVERRVKLATGPLEKKIKDAETRAATAEASLGEATARIRQSTINSALSEAATKAGVDGKMLSAVSRLIGPDVDLDDAGNVIAREGGTFTPGVDLGTVFAEAKQHFPGLWPTSVGGGAKGGGSMVDGKNNPFSHAHWNVTDQMKLSDADAERLARAAGVDPRNPKRPEPPKA